MMRNLRNLAVGFSLGIVATATVAWALEVKIPPKLTARANLVVDEVGNALFGATPGNVAVTNLPAVQQVQVTNFPPPAGGADDELWSQFLNCYGPAPDFPPACSSPQVLTIVPAGKRLVITDVSASSAGILTIEDTTGIRAALNTASPNGAVNVSLASGIVFEPGTTVGFFAGGNPFLAALPPFVGLFTFSGRLVPVS
jgi:hypothetical protein